MAEIISRVDDLDNTLTAAQTITFSLRDTHYEIDLADKNAAKLDKLLEPFIEKAREVTARRAPRRRTASTTPVVREDLDAIRAFAKTKGYTVSEKGRIPRAVKDEYYTETGVERPAV